MLLLGGNFGVLYQFFRYDYCYVFTSKLTLIPNSYARLILSLLRLLLSAWSFFALTVPPQ